MNARLAFGLALAAVLSLTAAQHWRKARLAAEPRLPLTFAHNDHGDVDCIACHHEFVDDTPRGQCIECHLDDAALRSRIEADFHGLCRDCHVDRAAQDLDGGPLRRCTTCHTPDEAF